MAAGCRSPTACRRSPLASEGALGIVRFFMLFSVFYLFLFHRYTVLYFLLYYTVPPCAAQDAVCKYLRRVASPPRR